MRVRARSRTRFAPPRFHFIPDSIILKFANDISIGTRTYKQPFRVISLCDNNAVITAIANDDGFEKIFSQQLKVLLKKQDVVVSISASGNA